MQKSKKNCKFHRFSKRKLLFCIAFYYYLHFLQENPYIFFFIETQQTPHNFLQALKITRNSTPIIICTIDSENDSNSTGGFEQLVFKEKATINRGEYEIRNTKIRVAIIKVFHSRVLFLPRFY